LGRLAQPSPLHPQFSPLQVHLPLLLPRPPLLWLLAMRQPSVQPPPPSWATRSWTSSEATQALPSLGRLAQPSPHHPQFSPRQVHLPLLLPRPPLLWLLAMRPPSVQPPPPSWATRSWTSSEATQALPSLGRLAQPSPHHPQFS